MLLSGICFAFLHFFSYPNPVDSVLAFNNLHTPTLDFIFKYLTKLGEEIGIIAVVLVFAIKKEWRWLVSTAVTFTSVIAISSICKHYFFTFKDRPRTVLHDDKLIHFVQGVEIHLYNSFPSGHTITAVTCCTLLALYFAKHAGLQVAFAIFAIMVALSRVYLFQHFFIDIATSIFLSLFVTIAIELLMSNWINQTHKTLNETI